MAFDYGKRRIGVAVGNRLVATAQPLGSIQFSSNEALFQEINTLLRDWQPTLLLVGLPLYPDGKPHQMTREAQRFSNRLSGRYRLPVTLVDERYSSVEAERRHTQDSDAEAACIILEQYLSESSRFELQPEVSPRE